MTGLTFYNKTSGYWNKRKLRFRSYMYILYTYIYSKAMFDSKKCNYEFMWNEYNIVLLGIDRITYIFVDNEIRFYFKFLLI